MSFTVIGICGILLAVLAAFGVRAVWKKRCQKRLEAEAARRRLTGDSSADATPHEYWPEDVPAHTPASLPPETKRDDGSVPPARTLDEMYAEANGMWVCRHCETLNDQAAGRCAACGSTR